MTARKIGVSLLLFATTFGSAPSSSRRFTSAILWLPAALNSLFDTVTSAAPDIPAEKSMNSRNDIHTRFEIAAFIWVSPYCVVSCHYCPSYMTVLFSMTDSVDGFIFTSHSTFAVLAEIPMIQYC